MIPDEAVQAARAMILPYVDDDHFDLDAVARAALEAAAPHLMARSFEEGYGLGYSDHMWSKGHEPRERNPYRTNV